MCQDAGDGKAARKKRPTREINRGWFLLRFSDRRPDFGRMGCVLPSRRSNSAKRTHPSRVLAASPRALQLLFATGGANVRDFAAKSDTIEGSGRGQVRVTARNPT